MKRLFLLLSLLPVFSPAFSQVHIGLKGGISTTSLDPNEILVIDDNGNPRLNVALKDAKYGVHAGLIIQALFNKFLVQPEINFNSNKVDYELTDLTTPGAIAVLSSEKYQYVDIPILFGFQFGAVRIQAGPEAHIFVASISNFDQTGYDQVFDTATFGWLGGIGINIRRALLLDIRYEGNFSNFGNHLEFDGLAYEFDQSPTRLLFSLGFMFGKKKKKNRKNY